MTEKNLKKFHISNSGFTIVELLVIVLIIGILVSILVITYSGIQQRQHNTTRISDIKLIQSHLDTFFAQNLEYPTLNEMNNPSWRDTNLVRLDPNAIRDPLDKSSVAQFAPVPTKAEYSYQPTAADGVSPCDNKTIVCTKYTLTATLEGNSGTYALKSP